MNAQSTISVPQAEQETRWADPAVKRFHAYLSALEGHLNPETDAASLCRQLIDDLEAFDCSLPTGEW